MNKKEKGILYIVSTPIGNLADISQRAIATLDSVDLILAEDTRHSRKLLSQLPLSHPKKPLCSFHEHNEQEQAEKFSRLMSEEGQSLALISDAGTPLISDPGYVLVRKAQEKGIRVVPIPGPSALIAALSASGLATDRFIFEGFLSARKTARRQHLEALRQETRTLIFYEAPHRIIETLQDMQEIFGVEREAVLARELTKTFETILRAKLEDLLQFVKTDSDQTRGEIVLLVAGATAVKQETQVDEKTLAILKMLADALPPKKAAEITGKITGVSKQTLYDILIKKDV